MEDLEKDLVRIEIMRLKKTGMLIGVCRSMRGLVVHGRSVDEMEGRIPAAIAGALEAEGLRDVGIRKIEDVGTDDVSSGLTVRRYEIEFRRVKVVH